MAYTTGDIIAAADHNGFVGTQGSTAAYASQVAVDAASPCIGAVYGVGFGDRGYGQNLANGGVDLTTVSASDIIDSDEWTDMRNALADCRESQTGLVPGTVPPVSDFNVGGLIYPEGSLGTNLLNDELDTEISDADTNRLTASAALTQVTPTGTSTINRTGNWGSSPNTINATFEFAWTTEDECRYFFNSGGNIQVSMTHVDGTAGTANRAWHEALEDLLGTLTMDVDSTQNTGTRNASAAGIGYYDLTTDFADSRIYNGTNMNVTGSPYDVNDVFIDARVQGTTGTNGSNGRRIQLRIILQDQNTSALTNPVTNTTTATFRANRNSFLADPAMSTPSGTNVDDFD